MGQNVVVGAGAKVLGNLQIGNNVRIGAGSVVLRDVSSNHTVVGIPARIVRHKKEQAEFLDHEQLPDVEAQVIRVLFNRIKFLEMQIESLKGQSGLSSATERKEQTYHLLVESNLLIEDFLDGAGI